MSITHSLLSNATVLGPMAISAGVWYTCKNVAVIRDCDWLWDWADAIAGVIGGALVFGISLFGLPDQSAWIARSAYPSAVTTLWLTLMYIYVSAFIEIESNRNTPPCLEPFAERVASDIR